MLDRPWFFLVFSTFLLLMGCATLYPTPEYLASKPGNVHAIGIASLLAEHKQVDIVSIHGMCRHDFDWVTENFQRIQALFPADRYEASPPVDSPSNSAATRLYTGSLNFKDGHVLTVYAILWSDETLAAKRTLCYDRQVSDTTKPDASYCIDQWNARPATKLFRASLNNALKGTIMDECLADAIAYVGPSKDAIQSHVAVALSTIGREEHAQQPLVVLTESLGSKVFFDTLLRMLGEEGGAQAEQAKAARSIAARLRQVHMGANQIPILSLAAIPPGQTPPSAREGQENEPWFDSMTAFLKVRKDIAIETKQPDAGRPIPIVAYSDPNDLLSFPLTGSRQTEIAESMGLMTAVDVITSNDYTWFGLVENPLNAHMGYRTSRNVKNILKCGLPADPNCTVP